MVEGHPLLDELFLADRGQETWSRSWRLLQTLWQANFDLVLELSGGDRGAFYTLATRAQERVGFERPGQPSGSARVCSPGFYLGRRSRCTWWSKTSQRCGPWGWNPATPACSFFGMSTVETRVADRLKSVGCGPGNSRSCTREPLALQMLDAGGYARVIEYIQEVVGLSVVLTAARAPHEQELIQEILAESRQTPINLAGQLTLKELGAIIAKTRFFFGADSAPMHLAAAVNTPAVALSGPSGVYNWGPWGEGHLVIQKDSTASPAARTAARELK